MKKVYDFVFCEGVITPAIVFYLVRVGSSQRDQSALSSLSRLVKKRQDVLFCLHSQQMADFIGRVALSLFPSVGCPSCPPISLLKRQVVEITWLNSFVRKYPLTLLNSQFVGSTAVEIYKRMVDRKGKNRVALAR